MFEAQAANQNAEDESSLGDRGRGFGRGIGSVSRSRPLNEEWIPKTKLGRLVKHDMIGSLEEIYMHSIPIKESQIVDKLFKSKPLFEEVIMIIQRYKNYKIYFFTIVVIGDQKGHIGLGINKAKEVQIAIKGAFTKALLSLIPVRRDN